MKNFLAEFFYSAILWGSLATLLLWWLRRRITNKWGQRFLFVPFWWLAIHTAIAWYGFVLPPSGRLVDADSGEPIKNTRVIATWISYPMAIWVSHCSGRQAQLTDADGDFAFRFAPFPTLLFGTTLRGINPEVPGRIDNRELAFVLVPLWGKLPIQKYAPGRSINSELGTNTECRVDIAPQFVQPFKLLPGEENPFDLMYREACVEKRPDTYTNWYMHNLMRSSSNYAGYRYSEKDRSDPRWLAVQKWWPTLSSTSCPPIGDLCAAAIPPEAHDGMCEFYSWQREMKRGAL